MKQIEIKVPDIGDFNEVEVIDILVGAGDEVAENDSLITVESDKASMDIPSPHNGKVSQLLVQKGDKVSQGSLIAIIEPIVAEVVTEQATETAGTTTQSTEKAPQQSNTSADKHAQVVVIGSGPGGYTAAFRTADLGLKTILIERHQSLGGVCLNVGCIPSKALLHAAKVIAEAEDMSAHGVSFGKPKVDIDQLRDWKQSVINKLTDGLVGLAKQRKVEVVNGTAEFIDSHRVSVVDAQGETQTISFDQCIIAAGSQPVSLPFLPDDPRIINSTGALELSTIPKKMLILGGGIIGLEMATVYDALGSEISVVEMLDSLMAGADKDIVRPFFRHIKKRYKNIWLNTRVTQVTATKDGLEVSFEGAKAPATETYDSILVSVGRTPNGLKIGAEKAGVNVDQHGFIAVDNQQRTNVPHIFAIGDIVGQPMLAHKATHEAKIAAEVCAGQPAHFDTTLIPSVAYTDPEVAWVGITETQAQAQDKAVEKAVFPWAASGRSLSVGRNEGMTKLLFDKDTHQVVGGGIVGPNAGELIAEVALAIEMKCDATDISLTIHPHPTLSETIAMVAEVFEGTITDIYAPKKPNKPR